MSRSSCLISIAIGLIGCSAVITLTAASTHCEADYQLARVAVARMRAPQQIHREFDNALMEARRMAHSNSRRLLPVALQKLDGAITSLKHFSGAASGVSSDSQISEAIQAFSRCLHTTDDATPVQLTVRVFIGENVPASGGITISIDGENVATTSADGTASVSTSPGDHTFGAVAAVDTGAFTTVSVESGQTTPIDLVMGKGDFSMHYDLSIGQSVDGVVPRDFPAFSLRFLSPDGVTVPLTSLLSAEIVSAGGVKDVTSGAQFATDGSLTLADPDGLRAWLLDQYGPFDVHVRATDVQGQTYSNSIRFDLGRYSLAASFSAPSGVSVDGMPVRITNYRDGLSFWATVTGTSFTYPALLPEGSWAIAAETASNGTGYHGYDAVVLDRDQNVGITMISFAGGSSTTSARAATAATTLNGAAQAARSRMSSARRSRPDSGQTKKGILP
jgi:hypothetical protein